MSGASASRSAWPAARSPVVDIIEVSDRIRSGYSMATVWAIIPPSDAPARWALARPSASNSPTVSAAMSDSV